MLVTCCAVMLQHDSKHCTERLVVHLYTSQFKLNSHRVGAAVLAQGWGREKIPKSPQNSMALNGKIRD